MTDFETTSLTLQAATTITSTLIGLGQIAVVWFGIRRMVDANDRRAEDGAARRDRVRKRAEEAGIAIAALNALIAQQGG